VEGGWTLGRDCEFFFSFFFFFLILGRLVGLGTFGLDLKWCWPLEEEAFLELMIFVFTACGSRGGWIPTRACRSVESAWEVSSFPFDHDSDSSCARFTV
jgi:hypothetical protein